MGKGKERENTELKFSADLLFGPRRSEPLEGRGRVGEVEGSIEN